MHTQTHTPDPSQTMPAIPCEPTAAAEEAARFLVGFSTDAEARERFAIDKEAFLRESDLSEGAREILMAPNANTLLRELNQTSASLLAVIILETVTTEVVVL